MKTENNELSKTDRLLIENLDEKLKGIFDNVLNS
jgi:hypothetical protein